MKAVVCTKYGPPEVLQLIEVPRPVPKDDEVLIKIHASAVTASDCIIRSFDLPGDHKFPMKQIMGIMMRIFIGFQKPRKGIMGMILSGEIVALGKGIKKYKIGDQVFGMAGAGLGTYAEYKCMSEEKSRNGCFGMKPENMSHDDAASVCYGGILALHFMKRMKIDEGTKVLIYGASGAIGTMAVQIANQRGADVTAVCSGKNLEWVKALGAQKVLDYTKEDDIERLEVYDYVFDAVGNNKKSQLKSAALNAIKNDGKYISVDNGIVKLKYDYLKELKELCEADHIRAITDRKYALNEIIEAHRYVDQKHKKGNVVITVSQ